jgi:hypothetical protein
MLEFFRLGIKMANLEEEQSQSLNTELNSLLNKYDLDLEFTK